MSVKSKVRNFLSMLEKDLMLVKKTDNKKTTLIVLNYEVWQDSETAKEPQKNHERTTKEPQKDTNKNVKNEKNEKKNIYGEYKHIKLSSKQYQKLINDYGEINIVNLIKKMDEWIQKMGKPYKDYNLALRDWAKKDDIKKIKDIESEKIINETEKERPWNEDFYPEEA